MLKILYFSGDNQFFRISPGIKSICGRGRKPVHLLTGEEISANLLTGEATGVHFTGTLVQGVIKKVFIEKNNKVGEILEKQL